MTAPARISQADMARAMKAAHASGYARARVLMDLQRQQIEVILGEPPESVVPPAEWNDDD